MATSLRRAVCPYCTYIAVSADDLFSHQDNTHRRTWFMCRVPGCRFVHVLREVVEQHMRAQDHLPRVIAAHLYLDRTDQGFLCGHDHIPFMSEDRLTTKLAADCPLLKEKFLKFHQHNPTSPLYGLPWYVPNTPRTFHLATVHQFNRTGSTHSTDPLTTTVSTIVTSKISQIRQDSEQQRKQQRLKRFSNTTTSTQLPTSTTTSSEPTANQLWNTFLTSVKDRTSTAPTMENITDQEVYDTYLRPTVSPTHSENDEVYWRLADHYYKQPHTTVSPLPSPDDGHNPSLLPG